MRTFQATDLLPGIANEVLIAKSDTIWQGSQSVLNPPKLTEPYIFIASFCENKKHKNKSPKTNRFSSPNTSISKSPNKGIRGRKSIQSAASSPNIALKSAESISQTPKRPTILTQSTNFDLNVNLSENGTQRSKSETNLIEKQSILQKNEDENDENNPLLNIQPIEMYDEKNSEKWFLKCVCGVKTGEGSLICCDKCGYWQHCICFNYNSHTSPENYICVFCEQKRIRCKCGNNLDYNFSIIQCSNCGYYVHRRCEGLNYGPLPSEGDFLCHFCGKTKNKYGYATLPTKNLSTNSLSIADSSYYFDPARMNQINASIINLNTSPFKKLIYTKFSGKEINAKTFFETIYNKYRTFFFICHPLYTSTTSKKKRSRLLTSFLAAFEYLVFLFYGIMHEKCVELFDTLIFDDLYVKKDPITKEETEQSFDLSENARLEIPNLLNNTNHIIHLSSIPKSPPIRQTKASGLMAMTDLHPDQFVMLVDGLVGDLEEFPYDPKVNSFYYQIIGTRFVLDTTRISDSPLHLMKRSIYGNCALKLIKIDDTIKCGLFIMKNHITTINTNSGTFSAGDGNGATFSSDHSNNNSGFNGVKSGSILTLGIDFMPAVLDERKISQYLAWHCSSEIEDELKDIQNGTINENSQDRDRDKYSDRERDKEKEKDKDIYYYYNTKSRRSSEYKHYNTGNKGKKTGKASSSSGSNQTSFPQSPVLSNLDSTKKKRGRKMKRKNTSLFSGELTLFSLFENENPGDILFNILDDENQQSESDENQELKDDDDGNLDAPSRSRSWNDLDNGNDTAVGLMKKKSDSVDSMNKLLNNNNSNSQ